MHIMTKEEMLSFMEKTKRLGSRLGLSRIKELMKRLSDVQEKIPAIHVAGTNGKGSVCAYLSSILMAAGKKTGLFTSPAIGCENERIRINNVPITDEEAAEVFSSVKACCDKMVMEGFEHPTEFEAVTAAAFLFFHQKSCDLMVIETGMGGRLDSTNIIQSPLLSVITSISFDHTAFLGKTLSDIASEKAGIIKEHCPVLVQKQSKDDVTSVFREAARLRNAEFHEVSEPALISRDLSGQCFSVDGLSLKTSLLGTYQLKNAATAVSAAKLLRVPDEAIIQGIADARWEARFELLQRNPLFFCDGGHNAEGAKVLYESLNAYFPGKKIIFITGVLKDKDYEKMYEIMLPLAECFFTITPKNERALSADALAAFLNHKKGQEDFALPCGSVEEAVELAMKRAGHRDIVCSFGSLYFQGEIRRIVLSQEMNLSKS